MTLQRVLAALAPLELPPSPDAVTVPTRRRIVIAFLIAACAFVLSFLYMSRRNFYGDFFYPWFAARLLLQGHSPYLAIPGSGIYPVVTPFVYPLPAVLLTVPVASLALPLASALFFSASTGLLAFGLMHDGYYRLPLFVSAPFISAATQAQWSPIVCAAAFLPSLGFLIVMKPNLGLAIAAFRPGWRMAVGATVVLLASLVAYPAWPAEWLHNVQRLPLHGSPITVPGGILVLVALLFWRLPEARLLVAMACVPQLLFWNDQLPLLLVARTRREALALTALSLVGYVAWQALLKPGDNYGPRAAPYILALIYLPALLVVLRHGMRARAEHRRQHGDNTAAADVVPVAVGNRA